LSKVEIYLTRQGRSLRIHEIGTVG